MKALIICPDPQPLLPVLFHAQPLALVPMLGETLLSSCLSNLAAQGVKHVTVLASDRPDQVRAHVGAGERWGLRVEVKAEMRQLTVEEAREKYSAEYPAVVVADRPAESVVAALADAQSWFRALQERLPQACHRRVGVREIAPGIWAGLKCKIDPSAHMQGPCWLGEGVWVRAGAKIGPQTFIEDHALIDHDAEVIESWVGPATYVGAMTHLAHSLACGRDLLNWETGSFTEIADIFLLASLSTTRSERSRCSWIGRAAAAFIALLTSPVALIAWWRGGAAKHATLDKQAVTPPGAPLRWVNYREFATLPGLWRRWPQLWNIVRGEFSWVGNRPLTGEQAANLTEEFERLWLAAPIGLFSLADAEGSLDAFDDEARTHASFYAAQASARLDRDILRRCLGRLFRHHSTSNP